MIFTAVLPGVATADVRCKWLTAGVLGVAFTPAVIIQVGTFPEFRIDESPPANWEELYAYDVNDASNYTHGKVIASDAADTLAYIGGIDLDGTGRVNVGKIHDATITGDGQPGTEFGV